MIINIFYKLNFVDKEVNVVYKNSINLGEKEKNERRKRIIK